MAGLAVLVLGEPSHSTASDTDPHSGSIVYYEFRDSIVRDSFFEIKSSRDPEIATTGDRVFVDTTKRIRIHTFHTKNNFGRKIPIPFLTTHQYLNDE